MSNTLEPDWSLLDLAYVRDICSQAARRVRMTKYRNVVGIETDDLRQHAYLCVATKADIRQVLTEEEVNYGYVHRMIEADLLDYCQKMHNSAKPRTHKPWQDEVQGRRAETIETIAPLSDDYTRELVDMLLPAVWDESYCLVLPAAETAPDKDMPRAATNPATSNNLAAYVADIRIGWTRAPLSLKERRALLMLYGLGWKPRDVAEHENVSTRAIEYRVYSGIGKIVARLNGGYWYELEAYAA